MRAGTQSVERWVARLGASSARNARSHLRQWLNANRERFKGYTPDQLVDYQRHTDADARFDVLDAVQQYVA